MSRKVSLVAVGAWVVVIYLLQMQFVKAAINEQIPFYGTLQDTSGTNLSGTYDMVFRFYDSSVGGTLLDTSTHTAGNGNAVTVTNGEFSALLGSGSGNTLDGIDFNTANIYVGLTIGADSEMTPRERLASAAYSFNTDTLDGYDSLDLLRLNATNTIVASASTPLLTIRQNGTGDILNILDGATEVFTILDGGNVGIGNTNPGSRLSITGDISVSGAYRDTSGDAGTSGQVLLSTLTGTNWTSTSSLGITASLGNNSVTPNNILTTGQTDEFCLTYETTGSTWEWQTCGGGGGSLFTDGGATTYLTATGDNLAIGSTTASEKLFVAGNIAMDGAYIKFSDYAYGSNQYFFASTSAWTYAIGDTAGASNSGFDNFFVGVQAGELNAGDNNNLLGDYSGRSNTGSFNFFVGYQTGQFNTGDANVLLGYNSGRNNTGNENFFAGSGAGESNTANYSNFIGSSAGALNIGDYNNYIGYQAGSNASTSNSYWNNYIGHSAGANSDGHINNFIGYLTGFNNDGSFNTFVGNQVGRNSSGGGNTFVGEEVGYQNTGNSNSVLGYYAAYGNSGGSNAMIGSYSGYSNSGSTNDLIGYYAGYDNSGSRNFISGSLAGYSNQGDDNIFIGWDAGYVNRGDYNQFIGSEAGHYLNSTGTVAIGSFAMRGGLTSLYASLNSTAIGYRAGYNIRNGADNNIFLGYQAGDNITTGDNNIIIGYDVDHVSATLSNRLNIGNLIFGTGLDGTGTTLASGNVGIGTSTPLQKLQVRGDIRVGTSGSNGCLENYGGGVIGGTCSSDERLKTDIEPIATEGKSYLEAIAQLTPVNYKWNEMAGDLYGKDTQMANLGLIAQDVEEVFPELISRNSDDYRQVNFQALPFYLIEAIKELWMKVSGLEEKVQEIDDLRERIERLESQNNVEYTPPQPTPELAPSTEDNGSITDTPTEPETDSSSQPEPEPEPQQEEPAPTEAEPAL